MKSKLVCLKLIVEQEEECKLHFINLPLEIQLISHIASGIVSDRIDATFRPEYFYAVSRMHEIVMFRAYLTDHIINTVGLSYDYTQDILCHKKYSRQGVYILKKIYENNAGGAPLLKLYNLHIKTKLKHYEKGNYNTLPNNLF